MRIALVDDAAADLKLLYDYVSQYCRQEHFAAEISTFQNGNDFLKAFQNTSFQLVFLDIYMNDINGIDVASAIRKKDPKCLTVFSTSSRDHAVTGFRLRTFDYLVKPYSYRELSATMDLCAEELTDFTKYIEVKEGRIFTRVFLEDIYYVDYHNHYIQIHTDKCVIRSYMPFPKFRELLGEHPQFLCCYRNCLVNMKKVSSIEDAAFILKNGESVPIFKKNKQEIRQAYADFVFSCVK